MIPSRFARPLLLFLFIIANLAANLAGASSVDGTVSDDSAFRTFMARIHRGETVTFEPEADASETSPYQFADFKESYDRAYKNGDVNFLIGDLSESMGENEWRRYFSIARWLTKHYFRPIINPSAQIADLRAAVQDPRTSVIIWSSHGGKSGKIWDSRDEALPDDAFVKDAGPRFKLLILSNCSGEKTIERYQTPKHTIHWEGTTRSSELFDFLISNRFDAAIEKALGIKL